MGAGLLQPTHIIFVIVIALLVFGPKRLPEMGRSIGNGIREFKDSIDGNGSHDSTEHHAEATMPAAAQQPLRVTDLPPAGPPPAAPAPAATPSSASAPAPAPARSTVSR
jgi:sec-independent protein translocase protein TatA